MFFILSKTVALLLRPSIFLCLVGLIGLVLMLLRWRRTGRTLTIFSFVALVGLGLSPLGNLLTYALEARFPQWEPGDRAPDGIVVLGGALSPRLSRLHDRPIVGSDAGRILAMARLSRVYPQARIVYSGGDGTLRATEGAEAEHVLPLLDLFGIPRERVLLEPLSRNTAENAAFSKELVKPRPGERWLLVTSAQHMPRAIGSFRKAGFDVEAYPTDWHADPEYVYWPGIDFVGGLVRLNSASSEWMGLTAYWLTGRTSAFFPAP